MWGYFWGYSPTSSSAIPPKATRGIEMPKQITPLSDAEVRKAKPKERDYKLFDGGGLHILVKTQGGKLWRLKYRFGGTESLLSLGRYPHVSLVGARKRREETKTFIAQGIDPGASKKEQEAAKAREQETFEVVARE